MKRTKRFAPSYLQWVIIALGVGGVMLVVAYAVRLPISPYLDFRVLYFANKGILSGDAPLYDVQKQTLVAAQYPDPRAGRLPIIPFPYLPWLALGTLFLGVFPIEVALFLWIELNLLMLFASVWLLTDDWDIRMRMAAFPAAFLFLPVMGTLSIGQYDIPILTGMSLCIYGLRREKTLPIAAGAWLAIIKPHLGAFFFLALCARLLLRRDMAFEKRALYAIAAVGAVLCLAGFLADPAWLVTYPKSLLTYGGQGHIVSCSECASLPVFLSRAFFGGGLSHAAGIALALLAILASLFFVVRSNLLRTPSLLLAAAAVFTLLVSPYLYNYDFLLLLVPFLILFKSSGRIEQILLGVCWLAPTIAIALYGRSGNVSLLAATFITTLVLYARLRSPQAAASAL